MLDHPFSAQYGPWALITGASEGTGSAFAAELAQMGLNLILVARREGPLEQVASKVRAHGRECITLSVDLSRDDAADRIIATTGDREVGLIIANAGADPNHSQFLEKDIAAWDQLVSINVITTMRLVHHFGRAMAGRGRGGMILVGSHAGHGGIPGISVYCGAKAFVHTLAEGLWSEFRPCGVDVLGLVLAHTDTPAYRKYCEETGQTAPESTASPQDVAILGLEKLRDGPIHNWGWRDDEGGESSAAHRRERMRQYEEALGSTQAAGAK